MAFPLPSFSDDDNNSADFLPQSQPVTIDVPIENPFCSHFEHIFTTMTKNNLKYDSSHPVYSTQSCQVYIAVSGTPFSGPSHEQIPFKSPPKPSKSPPDHSKPSSKPSPKPPSKPPSKLEPQTVSRNESPPNKLSSSKITRSSLPKPPQTPSKQSPKPPITASKVESPTTSLSSLSRSSKPPQTPSKPLPKQTISKPSKSNTPSKPINSTPSKAMNRTVQTPSRSMPTAPSTPHSVDNDDDDLTNKDPVSYYALKCSPYIHRLRNEYDVYQRIGKHPTIIKCYDTWVQKGVAFLQLELSPLGSIRRTLLEYSDSHIWKIFSHIIFALSTVHDNKYIHLDISPSNILQFDLTNPGSHFSQEIKDFDPKIDNGQINGQSNFLIFKLSDFGTALQFGMFEEDCEGAGPYVSPEALEFPNGQFEVNDKSDIFSLGVVMLELITHKMAPRSFPGYENLRKGKYDLSCLKTYNDCEFEFVADMLDPNPTKRPTSAELMKIPRVKKEISDLLNLHKKKSVYKVVTVTPVVPLNKLPPETPYVTKYGPRARKITFDDEDDDL